MNQAEIKAQLNSLTANIDTMSADAKSVIMVLVNLVEVLAEQNALLKEKCQLLTDEINRLKGEQRKPDIKGNTKDNQDHSSEDERKAEGSSKPRKPKNRKTQTVKVNRTVTVELDKTTLPEDVIFKGYERRIFQNLIIVPDNVEFKLATYYSGSLKKTFIAPLPADYHGEFGPGIRTLVVMLYRDSCMTEPAIGRFLQTFGVQISRSTISQMITEGHEHFHQEKEDIVEAGLQASPYQHIDDTGCRVNGENWHTHILCNPYFTAYFTRPQKDRLTILDVLCRGQLRFKLNQDTPFAFQVPGSSAFGLQPQSRTLVYAPSTSPLVFLPGFLKCFGYSCDLMVCLGLRSKWLDQIKPMMTEQALTGDEMDRVLQRLFPNPKKQKTNRRIIREAAAITYYTQSISRSLVERRVVKSKDRTLEYVTETEARRLMTQELERRRVYRQSEFAIQYLMSDDAGQFKEIATHHALCWVHEGRHYKKLAPLAAINQKIVNAFITQLWDYYHALKEYQTSPNQELSLRLDACFETLFTTKTSYGALNQCIARTYAKKKELLLALRYPFLPLHNNPAELGARVQARIRDVNLQTITVNGTETKDTFATISQTARKLGVNIYHYLYDRISKRFEMPTLADLITLKAAQQLNAT